MNAAEAGKLLGLMALADNRKPPEDEDARKALIAFWLEMVGDIPFADAAQSVADHYRESREWIMPADVRRRAKAIRAQRLARELPPIPPAELADDQRRQQAAINAMAKQIADGNWSAQRALGPGQRRQADPPPVWQEAKAALMPEPVKARDPREVAREQAEEARRARAESDGAA